MIPRAFLKCLLALLRTTTHNRASQQSQCTEQVIISRGVKSQANATEDDIICQRNSIL